MENPSEFGRTRKYLHMYIICNIYSKCKSFNFWITPKLPLMFISGYANIGSHLLFLYWNVTIKQLTFLTKIQTVVEYILCATTAKSSILRLWNSVNRFQRSWCIIIISIISQGVTLQNENETNIMILLYRKSLIHR